MRLEFVVTDQVDPVRSLGISFAELVRSGSITGK